MNEKEVGECFNKINFNLMKLADYYTTLQIEIIKLKNELKIEKSKIVPP